ncbi:MAG: hypothetical protein ACXW03_05435 [Methylobacter sp.]
MLQGYFGPGAIKSDQYIATLNKLGIFSPYFNYRSVSLGFQNNQVAGDKSIIG